MLWILFLYPILIWGDNYQFDTQVNMLSSLKYSTNSSELHIQNVNSKNGIRHDNSKVWNYILWNLCCGFGFNIGHPDPHLGLINLILNHMRLQHLQVYNDLEHPWKPKSCILFSFFFLDYTHFFEILFTVKSAMQNWTCNLHSSAQQV